MWKIARCVCHCVKQALTKQNNSKNEIDSQIYSLHYLTICRWLQWCQQRWVVSSLTDAGSKAVLYCAYSSLHDNMDNSLLFQRLHQLGSGVGDAGCVRLWLSPSQQCAIGQMSVDIYVAGRGKTWWYPCSITRRYTVCMLSGTDKCQPVSDFMKRNSDGYKDLVTVSPSAQFALDN